MSKTATIKTFDDACGALKISSVLPDVSGLPVDEQKAFIAHYKLVIIIKALNAGWKPDWNDHSEYKYFPWFDVNASEEQPAGFGLSLNGVHCTLTYSCVGSRLCFKSRDLAKYAVDNFADLYKEYFLILNS